MLYRYDDRVEVFDCSSYYYSDRISDVDKERLEYVCALNVIPVSIFEVIVLVIFVGLLLIVVGLCVVI